MARSSFFSEQLLSIANPPLLYISDCAFPYTFILTYLVTREALVGCYENRVIVRLRGVCSLAAVFFSFFLIDEPRGRVGRFKVGHMFREFTATLHASRLLGHRTH